MVAKSCGCGATTQTVKCSTTIEIVCTAICGKTLNCGLHQCATTCHTGDCDNCTEMLRQECYCGNVGRKVACTEEFRGIQYYSCGEICGKMLSCGNHRWVFSLNIKKMESNIYWHFFNNLTHRCKQVCHEGQCEPCVRDANLVTTCPCGRSQLDGARVSCLDPISCCDKVFNFFRAPHLS